MRHRRLLSVLAVASAVAVGAVLSGCGSSGSGASGPGHLAASSSGSPQAADAAQPVETNPVGDIPDSTVYVPFQPQPGGYEIKVPEGWARSMDADAYLFTDKLNSVRLQVVPAPAAPSVDSARTVEVPRIQAAARRFTLHNVTTVHRSAGDAVLITYWADSPVDPVTNKVVPDAVERYEFWRAGTEVVVTLSGPVNADNVDPWQTITDSLRWL
jgi:hypothetical protein